VLVFQSAQKPWRYIYDMALHSVSGEGGTTAYNLWDENVLYRNVSFVEYIGRRSTILPSYK
jgi:hypothetical protein